MGKRKGMEGKGKGKENGKGKEKRGRGKGKGKEKGKVKGKGKRVRKKEEGRKRGRDRKRKRKRRKGKGRRKEYSLRNVGRTEARTDARTLRWFYTVQCYVLYWTDNNLSRGYMWNKILKKCLTNVRLLFYIYYVYKHVFEKCFCFTCNHRHSSTTDTHFISSSGKLNVCRIFTPKLQRSHSHFCIKNADLLKLH